MGFTIFWQRILPRCTNRPITDFPVNQVEIRSPTRNGVDADCKLDILVRQVQVTGVDLNLDYFYLLAVTFHPLRCDKFLLLLSKLDCICSRRGDSESANSGSSNCTCEIWLWLVAPFISFFFGACNNRGIGGGGGVGLLYSHVELTIAVNREAAVVARQKQGNSTAHMLISSHNLPWLPGGYQVA